MASEKQIAANRRNAQKSTGPHSQEGKARSRMNALRHGLASAAPAIDGNDAGEPSRQDRIAELYKSIARLGQARTNLFNEISQLLQKPPSEDLHKAVRRIGALQRYAARSLKEVKKLARELE